MKILKLLNKKYLSIVSIVLLIVTHSYSEDQPVDIWNTENEKSKDVINDNTLEAQDINTEINASDIYSLQSKKEDSTIIVNESVNSKDLNIIGLYDPEDYGLKMDMWINSNGDQLKNLFSKLILIELSDDANEIMNISMLTNAYLPQNNISKEEFLRFKSDWLIKKSDLNLIEEYLIKNKAINLSPELAKYLVDEYLSSANIKQACEFFDKTSEPIEDKYLSKFYIFCLINSGKKDQAQIFLDLKKEQGFKDKYFEKKIDYLLGYTSKVENSLSEKSVLDFHLAYKTNPGFIFEPNDKTNKVIWKYLSSYNLLNSFQKIKTSELDKISIIEKAVHNKNYSEKDLLELYKRFQFNINQLLNAQNSYKLLSNIEARALIYQKILLESETIEKLKLLKILKNSFEKDNLGNAFDIELKKFLEKIDPTKIPDNLTSFYYTNIEINNKINKKIKFNNDILHQSKLINYFKGNYSKAKIEKDVNNFLKKIKKNKKYFFSKKDIIFIEALKSDGIKIDKKYNDLYQVDSSEIPSDMQVMINNDEKGAVLLRIAEVIGPDKLERIDEDTLYFILSTLSQLNIDFLRNKILLKVLPLKV
ncbi:hypothetical protein OAN68_02290 [Candidatus Pelagibacter sp.]|nr:hypothetical protein [Candidatus Pelagibacter sp.]